MTQFSNGTNIRTRPINMFWQNKWQEESEDNKVASEIIETPEKYLLSAEGPYNAQGGTAGCALQVLAVTLGVGSVFAGSARMTQLFRVGSLTWREWLRLSAVGAGANYLGTWASIYALGDANAYKYHWMAYYYVKSCNRWEGRKILSNAPMMY